MGVTVTVMWRTGAGCPRDAGRPGEAAAQHGAVAGHRQRRADLLHHRVERGRIDLAGNDALQPEGAGRAQDAVGAGRRDGRRELRGGLAHVPGLDARLAGHLLQLGQGGRCGSLGCAALQLRRAPQDQRGLRVGVAAGGGPGCQPWAMEGIGLLRSGFIEADAARRSRAGFRRGQLLARFGDALQHPGELLAVAVRDALMHPPCGEQRAARPRHRCGDDAHATGRPPPRPPPEPPDQRRRHARPQRTSDATRASDSSPRIGRLPIHRVTVTVIARGGAGWPATAELQVRAAAQRPSRGRAFPSRIGSPPPARRRRTPGSRPRSRAPAGVRQRKPRRRRHATQRASSAAAWRT